MLYLSYYFSIYLIISLTLVLQFCKGIKKYERSHHSSTPKNIKKSRMHQSYFRQSKHSRNQHNNLTVIREPSNTTSKFIPIVWTDKQIVEELLKKYRFPDTTSNISVAVMLDIERVLTSENIDELCRLQFSVTQKWMESKLEYKHLRDSMQPIRLRSINYIWNPALTIENALNIVPVRKDSLKIYSSGVVEHVQTLQVILEAETDFRPFPFEKRNCTLQFSNDDSRAIWSQMILIELPFDTPKLKYMYVPTIAGSTSEFSIQSAKMRKYRFVEIQLKRYVTPWIYLLFAPCLIQLVMLWIVVWHKNYVGNSYYDTYFSSALLITTAITFYANLSQIPKTNIIKAIDIWIGAVLMNMLSTFFFDICNKNCYRRNRCDNIQCHCYEHINGEKSQIQMPYYTRFRKHPLRVTSIFKQIFIFFINIFSPLLFFFFMVYFTLTFVYPFYSV